LKGFCSWEEFRTKLRRNQTNVLKKLADVGG